MAHHTHPEKGSPGTGKSPGATPNRFPFSKTRLAALPAPAKGRAVYHDTQAPGLILRITDKGARTFYFYRKLRGRPVRLRLGRFPDISVEQARKACQKQAGKAAEGKDLQAERRAARHEQTVAGLFSFWLQMHAKQHKKTWKEDQRQYEAFLKPWANRRLSAIKKSDVQALHARVGQQNGRYAANRLLALVRAMFNKAPDMGYSGGNPTIGIKKFAEQKRDRFLREGELPAFFRALLAETNATLRDFFLLALLTGARRSNVQAMAWDDIDLAIGIWRIPQTKSGEPVVVPLSEAAVSILRTRLEARGDSPWVFPGRGKTGYLVEPKAAWQRICKRAGLSDLRVHDLRRSLGSWQAMTGASLPIIGKSLGHKQASTTEIYARLTVDPVRQSVTAATEAIFEAGKAEVAGSQGLRLLTVESGPAAVEVADTVADGGERSGGTGRS